MVRSDYGPNAPHDVFAWQIYTPDEISTPAEGLGLRMPLPCTQFDKRLTR